MGQISSVCKPVSSQTQFTGYIARTEEWTEDMAEVIIYLKENPACLQDLVRVRSRSLCLIAAAFMALMDPGIHVDVDRITAEPDEHTERFLAIVRADEVVRRMLDFKAQSVASSVEPVLDILRDPECHDSSMPLGGRKVLHFLQAAAEAAADFAAAGKLADTLGVEAQEMVKTPVRSDQSIIVEANEQDHE